MVDIFFLKTFVTAARKGSFRIAAERNFITQPAVSQQMRTLEQQFGCKLFQRQGKNVTLTDSGKILLHYAENILHEYQEAQEHIQNIESEYVGTIRVATVHSIGLYKLQPLIRKYLARHPRVRVKLEYSQSQPIYEMIQNQKTDFGFVAYPRSFQSIENHIFHNEPLVCIQSPFKPVFEKKRIQLSDLNRQPYITFSANVPTGKAIDNFLKDNHVLPQYIQDYQDIETLKSSVQVGMGFSIVPRSTIDRELKQKDLEAVQVKGLNIERPLAVIMNKNKSLTKSMRGFLKMFKYEPSATHG